MIFFLNILRREQYQAARGCVLKMAEFEFCMCDGDVDMYLKRDPNDPSESKWYTPQDLASSSSDEELWVLKAGSAYYHLPETQTNHWVQHEIVLVSAKGWSSQNRMTTSSPKVGVDGIREAKLTEQNKHDVVHTVGVFNLKSPHSRRLIQVQRIDIKTLLNGWKLYGSVIDTYIGMLNLRRRNETSFIMDTYHMTYLVKGVNMQDYEGMKDTIHENIKYRNMIISKWGINIKDIDLLIVPYNSRKGTHWEMFVIDVKFRVIRVYDSKDTEYAFYDRLPHLRVIMEWAKTIWTVEKWQVVTVSKRGGYNIPSQGERNGIDCGVLMLKYIESVFMAKPLNDMCITLDEGDSLIKKYREQLATELLCN